jgi:N,N'-diacetylchitobiose phosphorylase
LRAFVEAAEYLGRNEDVIKYRALAEKVRAACEKELWDGEWYLRGFTAHGLKIGSHENEEGKVFLESNTWAVVSGAASPERGASCMDAVDKYLFSKFGIHLAWPAFSKPNDDIGFIGRVYKGVKENAPSSATPIPGPSSPSASWAGEFKP